MVGFYEKYSTSGLLDMLCHSINDQKERFAHNRDVKIRLIMKELKTRELSQNQSDRFRRLVDRFTWM